MPDRICSVFFVSIDSLRDLSHHRNLQDLDLSHNAVEVLEGLSALKCLRSLKMNNNKVRRIEGLDGKGGRERTRNRNVETLLILLPDKFDEQTK